jgi:hypothetical protein
VVHPEFGTDLNQISARNSAIKKVARQCARVCTSRIIELSQLGLRNVFRALAFLRQATLLEESLKHDKGVVFLGGGESFAG